MNSRSLFFTLLIVSLLVSCRYKSNTYTPYGLTKLSDQELIDRARIGNFPNLNELIYKNERGEIIKRDSLIKIEPFDDLAFDDYMDEKGTVKIAIVRSATDKDRILRKKIDIAIEEGPILPTVNIEFNKIGKLLDTILITDQGNRKDFKIIDLNIDLHNLAIVSSILNSCGMPTSKTLSFEQLTTIWLVIQHSTTKYQKKYLPIFKQAAKNGDLDIRNILTMEDRILMSEGKPQIYGTQVHKIESNGQFELVETIDPEYLNQRRLKVGFEPIEVYLSNFGIKFNVEQKKK
jgi:hypothetical protein